MILNVHVVVACVNSSGQSDLVPMIVRCTETQFNEGDHTEVAKAACEEEEYGHPMVPFDNSDSHWGMMDLFNWDNPDMLRVNIALGVTE